MRLIALARDRYDDYFRRGLLEEAIDEGIEVLYIGFRRGEGKIDLVRNGHTERSIPLLSLPWAISKFARASSGDEETVIFNSAGYNWFWHVLFLRLVIPRATLVFDVYDWLSYDATGVKWVVMRSIDMIYRKVSDGMVVVSPELTPHYPGSFLLDNASYVKRKATEKPDKNEVAIVASFDGRLDFALMEAVVERLADVDFHFHGWISDDNPAIQDQFARFSQRPNVHYHGKYRNADLEALLQPYRIGLLPYSVTNRINTFVNPEKIYHYLQAGMEVIATPIPQANRMEAYLHLAQTPDEFAECITRLLGGGGRKNDDAAERNFHWSERWKQLRPYLVSLTGH